MSLDRRRFLQLALALGLGLPATVRAATEERTGQFAADVGILFGVLSFHLAGTIQEMVDRAAGRYEVSIRGRGESINNEADASGVLRDGRWAPTRARSVFLVHGRESRSEIAYDWAQRRIEYHSRSETFFLRRVRQADDVLTVPEATPIDDVVSATLNYADGLWPSQPDGSLLTHVVRRHRPPGEKPDDVQKAYRAELVPFVLRVTTEPATGRPMALFDLTRFSSWAKESEPARIVFGPNRRPEAITSSLMLGTSVAIRIHA
jgi:hypothetical protein